jgi:hypothetical protein
MTQIARDKIDPPALPDDLGFHGGYEGLEWLRLWEYNKQRTLDTFGAAWIDLPWWLREDMLKWIQLLAWFEADAKAPTGAGLPSIESR